jgi:hypothetical protein
MDMFANVLDEDVIDNLTDDEADEVLAILDKAGY